MVMSLALAGMVLAWIVVLIIGTGAGYGAVVAWSRWGAQLNLPTPVAAAATRLLGAGDAAPIQDTARSAEATGASMAYPAPPQITEAAATTPAKADPETRAEDEPEDATPVPRLSRSDALEELSVIFGASYEESKLLLASGLQGTDTHEEWARSMRGQTPPDGVPPALFESILNANPRDYAPRLAAHRERRSAIRELLTLWGVGIEQAEALYEAGYKNLESVRNTSTEKLAKVPGIGHALAFQIRAAAHGLAPTV